MEREAILDTVVRLTAETLDVDAETLTLETNFKELGADSFDLLELVTAFEDEFGNSLDDEELAAIATIGDAVAAIEKAL